MHTFADGAAAAEAGTGSGAVLSQGPLNCAGRAAAAGGGHEEGGPCGQVLLWSHSALSYLGHAVAQFLHAIAQVCCASCPLPCTASNQHALTHLPADTQLQAYDRERLSIAEERRGLGEERLAASRAADSAREAQMRLAEAVRVWVAQGVPIPFVVESEWWCPPQYMRYMPPLYASESLEMSEGRCPMRCGPA